MPGVWKVEGSGLAGDPPLYPIGCAGIISQAQRFPDGRFLVVDRKSVV